MGEGCALAGKESITSGLEAGGRQYAKLLLNTTGNVEAQVAHLMASSDSVHVQHVSSSTQFECLRIMHKRQDA